jgi:hypothetical protein
MTKVIIPGDLQSVSAARENWYGGRAMISRVSSAIFVLLTFVTTALKAETPVAFTSNSIVLTAGVTQLFQVNLTSLLSSQGSGQLSWSISGSAPAWMVFSPVNQTFSGTPALTDFGTSIFNLNVTDTGQSTNKGAIAQITLNVSAAPIWSATSLFLGFQVAGTPWTFNLNNSVKDPLGSTLSFQESNLPAWMSMSTAGLLSGTPQTSNIGVYSGITFIASGGHGASQASAFGIVIPAGAQLAVVGPLSFFARSCQKFSVVTEDGSGNALTLSTNATVNLASSGTSGSSLFANSSCSGIPVNNVVVPSGSSAADFYVMTNQAGTLNLSATLSPFTPGSLSPTVLAVGMPGIVLSANQTNPSVGVCVPIQVGLVDSGGNAYAPSTSVPVTLSASRSDVVFYSDPACTLQISQLTLPANVATGTVYASATVAESVSIDASSSGFDSGTLTLNFAPGAAVSISLSTPNTTYNVSTCWPVTESLLDSFKNLAVSSSSLSSSIGFSGVASPGVFAYSDSQCTQEENSVVIAAGQSSGVFYVSGPIGGALTVQASPLQLSVSPSLTVTLIQPPNISITGPSVLNFGNVVVNTTSTMTLTISNSGGDGQISSMSLLGGPFVVLASSTCRASLDLPEGASCTINVSFSPVTVGTQTGNLSIVTSSGAITSTMIGTGIAAPTPATVAIYANGVTNYLVAAVSDAVTINWVSANASSCTVTENDLAAVYKAHPTGGSVAGTWVGPSWPGTSGSQAVVAYSAPAERDVTYTVTCTSSVGALQPQATVEVKRYGFAAGGPAQVSYILGSVQEAQSCAQYIMKGVVQDYNCKVATWGTFWADGTSNPWALKPGTGPGQKWCSCFNPTTAPSGKPWAVKFGTPN